MFFIIINGLEMIIHNSFAMELLKNAYIDTNYVEYGYNLEPIFYDSDYFRFVKVKNLLTI